jgi:hypothetical protein
MDEFDYERMSYGMTDEEMLSEGCIDLLDFLPSSTRLVPLSKEEIKKIEEEANDPNTPCIDIDF